MTLDTARRFVSLDVPELDAEVVNSFVEVGADGATRFRCPCFVVRDSCGGRGSNKSSSVTLTRRRNLSKQPIIALVSTTARLGLAVAAGWAVRQRGACQRHISVDFFFFFVLLPWSSPLQLVAGAASAQAQKRVRHSDVGHAECEGLPVPVSAPVPGPAAGVSHSAAVVAPLVGHSSPSLDGTESKLDDPSAAAVLDGGAVASATDGMEDVVVLEPEAAAGVAAHNTWALPQALESSLSPVSG